MVCRYLLKSIHAFFSSVSSHLLLSFNKVIYSIRLKLLSQDLNKLYLSKISLFPYTVLSGIMASPPDLGKERGTIQHMADSFQKGSRKTMQSYTGKEFNFIRMKDYQKHVYYTHRLDLYLSYARL